jgi:glycosyltransferase involved in cell wall biosynthesis
MKVTVVNAAGTGGGAADAARGVYLALRRHTDIDTRMLVGTSSGADRDIEPILPTRKQFAQQILRGLLIEPTVGQDYWLPYSSGFESHPFVQDAEVLNFHNIHGGYFAYPRLVHLARRRRIVISMQDMWYMTGHCTYANDCDGWHRQCTPCPHLDWYPRLWHDTAGFHWRGKLDVYRRANATFVSCSRWLKAQAESSPLFEGLEVHHVANPVDVDQIRPLPRCAARELLRIPEDRNVLCFGAADVGEHRKGLPALVRHLDREYIQDQRLFLLLMGRDRSGFLQTLPRHLERCVLGAVDSPAMRAIVYAAADLFVFPALDDNLPNMLLEALAAGLPTVAFDIGGYGEAVIPDRTGALASPGDYGSFKAAVAGLLTDNVKRQRMALEARRLAEEEFASTLCAERYRCVFSGEQRSDIVSSSNA